MDHFELVSEFKPTGDQPQAIEELVEGFKKGNQCETLLGVTGSGKTFTMANVIQQLNKPTLIIAHNKTLAAQLYGEFKEFFPNNAVEYFVSYYDYYQPEAYVPSTDTYIEKDSAINDEIDKLRHSATMALMERKDVIIISSVSCIYGLGDPIDYKNMVVSLRPGMIKDRDEVIRKLIEIQYDRNDMDFKRGTFRVRGDVVEVFPSSYGDTAVRIEFFGDEVDRITEIDTLTGEVKNRLEHVAIFPNSHYVIPPEKMEGAIAAIEKELAQQVAYFKSEDKLIEAQRIAERTNFDMEMLRETGICSGIENYSRHMAGLEPGATPHTLMEYFGDDFLIIVDESHITVPQIRGMYAGDQSRKTTLVDYGFRLPSAKDNRPLNFDEFESMIDQIMFVSATPGEYESQHELLRAQQVIRPTGLLDPEVEVSPVAYAGSLFTKSLCFQDRFSSVLFCVSEDYRSLILCNFDLLSGKCHQKVVNNDDKTDGCCRFAEMFQKFVVTAALDYRLTDPISVCLENDPCVVLDLAEHAEIKTYVFLITVNFEDLIDLLQTLYCCKRACVVSQASCLCKYFAGPEQVWKFKECFFQRFRKFLFFYQIFYAEVVLLGDQGAETLFYFFL